MTNTCPVDASTFIKNLSTTIGLGFSINPLLGSGISSASGIIMGTEFSDYLAYCVFSALGNSRWDVSKNGWLPYPKPEVYIKTRQWTYDNFEQICRSNYEVIGNRKDTVEAIIPKQRQDGTDYSIASAINCPAVPANIRSRKLISGNLLARIAQSLRLGQDRSEPYEPLWPRSEQSQSSGSWLVELGVRSLADWRTTLHFLSRIEQRSQPPQTILSTPNTSVIDRFNTFITADKQPNLTHKILAALARPLRMRTILTTNFDTLLEEAFVQSGHNLTKFFVSTRGSLPDPFLVRAQPSILKLHGELVETRADLSLDEDPGEGDKQKFLKYFFDLADSAMELRTTPSHLLVLGFSASDMRIIRMIQYVLDRTAAYPKGMQPNIFWICYSKTDVDRVVDLFPSDAYSDRICVHKTIRPDLVLLELYQRLTLSLPAAGHTYEYNHSVPPSRVGTSTLVLDEKKHDNPEFHSIKDIQAKESSVIEEALKTYPRSNSEDIINGARDALSRYTGNRLFELHEGKAVSHKTQRIDDLFVMESLHSLIVPTLRDKRNDWTFEADKNIIFFNSNCGALEAMDILFKRVTLEAKQSCLWFELADYIDADGLLRDILRSIALRTGRFQRQHVTLHPLKQPLKEYKAQLEAFKELKKFLQDLCEAHHLSPQRWTILLYGRDVAGSCVDWSGEAWTKSTWDCLIVVLRAFASAGFKITVAYSCSRRVSNETEKINASVERWLSRQNVSKPNGKHVDAALRKFRRRSMHFKNNGELPEFMKSAKLQTPALSIFRYMSDRVIEKSLDDPGFRDFLYAVCLFRQSRRPSALFYEAVQPCTNRFNLKGIDNDVARSTLTQGWVSFLEECRVFYKKAGGHSWMHRDIRVCLLRTLDSLPVLKRGSESAHAHGLSKTHYWIGDWYEKAFYATGFAKPVLESLHHRFQAAVNAEFAVPSNFLDQQATRELAIHRFVVFRYSVVAIAKILISSRQYLKLWLANHHGYPMFSNTALDLMLSQLRRVADVICRKSGFKNECDSLLYELEEALRETQRSIRRESNTAISANLLPFSQQDVCSPLSASLRVQLNALLESTYSDESNWAKSVRKILRTLESEFGREAKELMKSCFMGCGEDGRVDLAEYAELKGKAINQFINRIESLPAFLVSLEVVAYAQLRRAKFVTHSIRKLAIKHAFPSEVRREWLRVTRFCNLGIDWCKHLSIGALRIDHELRVRLHSYYSVALANLDRFSEAHRHLNEANGINSKRESALANVEMAKLGIRRAEVILTEAHRFTILLGLLNSVQDSQLRDSKTDFRVYLEQIGPWFLDDQTTTKSVDDPRICMHPSAIKNIPCVPITPRSLSQAKVDISRLLVATLDDAWFTIENAERALTGKSQSCLWWGRLALMKLRACSYQRDCHTEITSSPKMRMLAYRHRRISPQAMWTVFETAILNDAHSEYRALRLIRYAATCIELFLVDDDDLQFCSEKIELLETRFAKLKTSMKRPGFAQFKQAIKATNAAVVRSLDLARKKKSQFIV